MATSAAYVDFTEAAAPSTPAAGKVRTYAKADGLMYQKDDAGTETAMGGGGGSGVATDPIWDAKGDLAGGTASNTAARLPVGSNNTILMAASGETTGLKWHALTTVDGLLGGDVTMTNANQFYDGPSGSFIAGTWLIWWKVHVTCNTAGTQDFNAKLWDGSTVWDESATERAAAMAGRPAVINGHALVTLGSTTTVKVSVANIRAAGTILRNTVNNTATSNAATRITGIRIA